MSNEKQNFWNQKVGGSPLALGILVFYIVVKYINAGWSYNFLWYSIWFGGIIINALITDLFQNTETWIWNSMKEIERKDIKDEYKFKLLKDQLKIAVERYDTVFFMINGKDWKKIFNRIINGSITVKELIVIGLYAIFDLVLKNGYLSITEPYDVAILFGVLIILKILDANSGFASLVAEMYKQLYDEEYTSTTMNTIRSYIRQLCLIFHIEYDPGVIETISKK